MVRSRRRQDDGRQHALEGRRESRARAPVREIQGDAGRHDWRDARALRRRRRGTSRIPPEASTFRSVIRDLQRIRSTRLIHSPRRDPGAGGNRDRDSTMRRKISGTCRTSGILSDNCVVYSAATLESSRCTADTRSCRLGNALVENDHRNIDGEVYASCSFGVGSVGVSTQIAVDVVAYLNYLTPRPASSAVPTLVCRATDKSIQLGSES